MFLTFLIRKLRFFSRGGPYPHDQRVHEAEEDQPGPALQKRLEENLKCLQELLGSSSDLKTHCFRFGPNEELSGALVFIDGLVDSSIQTEGILRPLKSWTPKGESASAGRNLLDTLRREVLCIGEIEKTDSLRELAAGCLGGNTILLAEGCAAGLVIGSKGWEKRGITEPQSESVIRGPREGFTENLRTNTALIRRKLKNAQLRVDHMTIGRKTQTDICLMYLDGVANSQVVEAVKYRIQNLKVDSILESGYIEEYIEDAPFSPFSTVAYSEKPDVVAAKLLEGRTAIVVDGTPFVLTVPMLFIESFQTAEDYYVRPLYATMLRMIRFVGYLITVFAPAVYIALTAFHQEMIPTTLLFTIANAREGTPFPVFIETMIMVFAFEVLREAGIRLPRPVGQAISIVGALVMGDAAVAAGVVGAPVVIVIALTAVSGFLVPNQNDAASIFRIIMMILAAFAGGYGIAMGFIAILLHLGSLSSFGIPYFDGFSLSINLQDSVARLPLWSMVRRPEDIARGDLTRRRFFVPPLRPFETQEDDMEDGDAK